MPNEDLSPPSKQTLRGHVLEWLAANDVDAGRIPSVPHMTLDGDRLTTDQKVQVDGRDQIDPATGDIARETVTYAVTVPPPPDVATWLLPRCTTCGR